jgi:DNA-binding response OmpR family regulator
VNEIKKRVLVIDDEQSILDMLKYSLEDEGYSVDVAADGDSAMNMLVEHSPDLVLLDIKLPDIDGYRLLEQIRKKSEVPVIMLTGVDHPVSIQHSVTLGADDYVTKPFRLDQLLLRIKNKLRRVQ